MRDDRDKTLVVQQGSHGDIIATLVEDRDLSFAKSSATFVPGSRLVGAWKLRDILPKEGKEA